MVQKTTTEKSAKASAKVEEKEVLNEADLKKKSEYLYAVGKRKTSIAQVRVYKKGEGGIVINEKDLKDYFPTSARQETVKAPLTLIGQGDKLNVTVKVLGGGFVSQSEAIRHGVSLALVQLNPNFRKPLKKAGFITRDARKKERKKPGLKGARRAPQWKKR
ncbi:30S ribosomal protein S9 [Candidatus Falkowbacteria bacterium CG10_big_fil_rev_8_21_14_0_10_39_11]|uniref:Small ribosomal subunit protein uS9 n=1 Tax=Candidatus Falkowbacteria bacterium CG10_big_fil_rev_8_21_14_0_10_39_11 TaxID=1974565 RepID=A0A2H0V5K0_9BACT|nr:MAG: 30S ribosomal protein S9 [Candidatus Falkowbacteria bacterium CG10_big_fil_rev_8_21_14_0_10_39_11]